MDFAAADIWQDFKTASRTERGTLDDNANEVLLGPRLNEAVRDRANGYLRKLDLGPATKATDERAKLLDLHWGHVEHDGAMLGGLGAAMTNFAETLAANVAELGKSWQGDSYNAFRTAVDKIQRTMAEYGEAATTTGEGLVNAMGQIRELYQTFADDSAGKHLDFHPISPPEKWHRIGEGDYTADKLAEACPSDHGNDLVLDVSDIVDYNYDCIKNNDEQSNMINGHWVTERRWDICLRDGCEESLDRVSIMYTNLVDQSQEAIDRIKGKLDNYFGAVDTVVDGVTGLYDAALGNVYTLGNAEAFTSLRVIGGAPSGGDTPVDQAGQPADGGEPVSVGGDQSPAVAVEPPQPEPDVEPAAVETPPDGTPAADDAADQSGSVKVRDGDRTIGVTSPDGTGRVVVTVQDGAGATKTYELDFDAASGLSVDRPEGAVPGAEQIPARTDGKCVIEDGPLTITAERPLFSPDSLKLVVDDGSGKPNTYTVDFDDQDTPDQQPSAAPAQAGPAPADATSAGPAAEPAPPSEPAKGDSAPPPSPAPRPATLTSPQAAWQGEQTGSVSGVLVPDQPGEAGLAKAPDADQPEVAGMAGAGLPIAGGSSGPAQEGGRAGSGWSVHGDLFDTGEPVYSMHGVLGDDDGAKD
ncbi:WXG100 family type VII secretion target [Actinophytocola oryzae]|uniref:Uncharacterized protein n=1 Tax=Actinophytocola oryzae TaxID=502181 RepID=A0A4R7VDF6_9PSEU|nr:WXG100 family type VII secretion target [Actinophytocola oryzae]TDV47176.1 hypothetical protein CLV71_110360 [Actinophytocola oryzae]